MLETALIRQECFLYCCAVLTHTQGPFCFLPHQWVGLGVHKALGGNTVRIAVNSVPREQKDIPHHVASSQPIKLGGEAGKGRVFRVMVFTFSSNCYPWWSPAFLEILLMGSGEWTTYYTWPAYSFCQKYPIAFNTTPEFSHFYSCDSPSQSQQWGVCGCQGLSRQLGLSGAQAGTNVSITHSHVP